MTYVVSVRALRQLHDALGYRHITFRQKYGEDIYCEDRCTLTVNGMHCHTSGTSGWTAQVIDAWPQYARILSGKSHTSCPSRTGDEFCTR